MDKDYYYNAHIKLMEDLDIDFLETTLSQIRSSWARGFTQKEIKRFAEYRLPKLRSKIKKKRYREVIAICSDNTLFDSIVFYPIPKPLTNSNKQL